MMSMVTEKDMQRVAQLLSYEQPLKEIHDRLTADGMSEEDFFFCYAAGLRLATTAITCEHGVPKKLERHLREQFFRPDLERCAACRREDEEAQERYDAEMDAFCERIKARRAAGG